MPSPPTAQDAVEVVQLVGLKLEGPPYLFEFYSWQLCLFRVSGCQMAP